MSGSTGRMLFTTKHDRRVWALDLSTSTLSVLHDCAASPDTPLDAVDNIVVHRSSGDVFVAEDGGNMQIGVLRDLDGALQVDAFLQFDGHDDSEVTGPAFSPDGTRLYFSSQRGTDGRGVTYEVTGPFTAHMRLRPAHRVGASSTTTDRHASLATGSTPHTATQIDTPASNPR